MTDVTKSNYTCCERIDCKCSYCSADRCEDLISSLQEGVCCDGSSCCMATSCYSNGKNTHCYCSSYGERQCRSRCGVCWDVTYSVQLFIDDEIHTKGFDHKCTRDDYGCYSYYEDGRTLDCWYDLRNPAASLRLSPEEYKWWQFLLVLLAGLYVVLFSIGALAILGPKAYYGLRDIDWEACLPKKKHETMSTPTSHPQEDKVMAAELAAFETQRV